MLLFIGKNYMRFYFGFVVLFIYACCSHANNNVYRKSSIKSMIVEEIMKKMSNLTSGSLSKAPPEKKGTVLKKIENKLRESAKLMGPDGNKYVKLIMEEFETKVAAPKEPKFKLHNIRKTVPLRNDDKAKPHSIIDSATKQDIIKDISNKIQKLAKKFLRKAKTIESKKNILEHIKQRIENSAIQKHVQLHNKHEKLKEYSNLIAQGLKVSMQKLLEHEAAGRRWASQEFTQAVSEESEVQQIHSKHNTTIDDDMFEKTMFKMDMEHINKYKNLISQSLNYTSFDPPCDDIVEDTCLGIQSFSKIPCGERKFTPIENLCNGVTDCLGGVDELNCTAQAMEKIRKATSVIAEIEASINRKCFASTDDHLLSLQSQILREVLQTQINFLENHVTTMLPQSQEAAVNQVDDEPVIRRTVTDVNLILGSLSYALDGALCARNVNPDLMGNEDARKFNDIEADELETHPNPKWSPKSCICEESFCKISTCESRCKRVCWQRYSLHNWGCQALSGATSVSLDVICDGKLDCFDETDESSCAMNNTSSSKFEAIKSYSNILDLLTTKSRSQELKTSRNKLLALLDLVPQLQKQTITTEPDYHIIKNLRDKAFMLLVSIYDDLLETTANMDELDDHYLILLSIHEKLLTALKHSNAGNENVIPSDGCYCRDGRCAQRWCKKNCIQACFAEPVLTRFACNVRNITVPIDAICNERKDCPNGEDEMNCTKEVCRSHHLLLLRHNLQKVGVTHKSSVLREVLESWKLKVSAALRVAESMTDRPNHKIMVDIITRVLHDLLMAFVAKDEYRKTTSDSTLNEFKSISEIVKQTLKSCIH